MTLIDFEATTITPARFDGVQPAARLRGVTRRYGRSRALQDLSFDLAPGSFVAVVGRSGAGKSSLLRLLAGEEATPVDAEVEVAKPVELLLPGAQILPWRRVWDGVAEGVPGGWRSAGDAVSIADSLFAVGLDDAARRWGIRLSDEDTLRAGLARALVRKPRLLLIDDAFRHLSPRSRATMQRLILDLWRDRRPTVLFATDDLNEALLLADRVLALEAGRLVADIAVDQPRPRALIDPELSSLRSELLAVLGHDFAAVRAEPPPIALEVFL